MKTALFTGFFFALLLQSGFSQPDVPEPVAVDSVAPVPHETEPDTSQNPDKHKEFGVGPPPGKTEQINQLDLGLILAKISDINQRQKLIVNYVSQFGNAIASSLEGSTNKQYGDDQNKGEEKKEAIESPQEKVTKDGIGGESAPTTPGYNLDSDNKKPHDGKLDSDKPLNENHQPFPKSGTLDHCGVHYHLHGTSPFTGSHTNEFSNWPQRNWPQREFTSPQGSNTDSLPSTQHQYERNGVPNYGFSGMPQGNENQKITSPSIQSTESGHYNGPGRIDQVGESSKTKFNNQGIGGDTRPLATDHNKYPFKSNTEYDKSEYDQSSKGQQPTDYYNKNKYPESDKWYPGDTAVGGSGNSNPSDSHNWGRQSAGQNGQQQYPGYLENHQPRSDYNPSKYSESQRINNWRGFPTGDSHSDKSTGDNDQQGKFDNGYNNDEQNKEGNGQFPTNVPSGWAPGSTSRIPSMSTINHFTSGYSPTSYFDNNQSKSSGRSSNGPQDAIQNGRIPTGVPNNPNSMGNLIVSLIGRDEQSTSSNNSPQNLGPQLFRIVPQNFPQGQDGFSSYSSNARNMMNGINTESMQQAISNIRPQNPGNFLGGASPSNMSGMFRSPSSRIPDISNLPRIARSTEQSKDNGETISRLSDFTNWGARLGLLGFPSTDQVRDPDYWMSSSIPRYSEKGTQTEDDSLGETSKTTDAVIRRARSDFQVPSFDQIKDPSYWVSRGISRRLQQSAQRQDDSSSAFTPKITDPINRRVMGDFSIPSSDQIKDPGYWVSRGISAYGGQGSHL